MFVKVKPSVERWTTKPVTEVSLSVQLRLIWLLETAVAVRLLGAAGGEGPPEEVQTSVIGAAACGSPYIAWIVPSTLRWVILSPYCPGFTIGPTKIVGIWLFW